MRYDDKMHQIVTTIDPRIPNEILALLLVLGVLIFVWDLFQRRSSKLRAHGGLGEKTEVVALKGSAYMPSKEYVSERLGLSSRPHGLVKEEGSIIPVDVNPLSKKIKDRHVVQMLVHLRLIEDAEGKRPPYGLLVMGPDKRPVKIRNSEEKQRWLETLLDEMRSIIDGVPAVPAPSYYKCKSCDVHDICAYTLFKPNTKPPPEPDEDPA